MLPSAGKTASASQLLDFGAEPSRPASLLCTLRTHQSPGEWQHSLPAYSLALAARDSHPLDFIKWFPLLHYWLHFHAYPSATYRKSYSEVLTNVTLLHYAQNLPQYQFARDRYGIRFLREASNFQQSQLRRGGHRSRPQWPHRCGLSR
jgi:hypothetical protein